MILSMKLHFITKQRHKNGIGMLCLELVIPSTVGEMRDTY